MQTSDKLFAQNWIEQFREDYYGPAGNMDCQIMDLHEVHIDTGINTVIMNCLHWASCDATRGYTWRDRYGYPFGIIALSR